MKYQPITRDHPVWKAYELKEDVLAYGFGRLEPGDLHIEVGLFGPVAVMTQHYGEEPLPTGV
jgi:hypothetical protein